MGNRTRSYVAPYARARGDRIRDAIEALGDELTPEEERKFDDVLVQKEKLRKRIEGSSSEGTPGEEIPVRRAVKLGRNDPCWCGSGKKYKKCHGT